MNRASRIVGELYQACNFPELKPVKEAELKEEFLHFYSRYDKRLKRCRRDRIQVIVRNDTVRLSLVFGKTAYGQVYDITQEDIK